MTLTHSGVKVLIFLPQFISFIRWQPGGDHPHGREGATSPQPLTPPSPLAGMQGARRRFSSPALSPALEQTASVGTSPSFCNRPSPGARHGRVVQPAWRGWARRTGMPNLKLSRLGKQTQRTCSNVETVPTRWVLAPIKKSPLL
jgi:hypothetical protein